MKLSNNLIGILNFLTLLLPIGVLVVGVWLHKQANTDCERWLEKPIIAVGVFLLIVSLMGFIGACFRVSWLLWFYLLFMFLLIVLLFVFTIFTFAVTNKGAGEKLSNKGYKEYRLDAYSHWLQKRVKNNRNWNKIKSCLQAGKFCSDFHKQYFNDTADKFYTERLAAFQSGCCKPSNDCGFTYVNPTNWTKTANVTYKNSDCNAWSNDPNVLCFNCKSCKAGVLQNLKTHWRNSAVVNIIFLIFLVIVYSIGCCAFKNSKRDNWNGY